MNFANKVAIVTGSAQGIGAAIAKHFAKNGAQVILVDMDEAKLKATQKEISDSKALADYVVADISKKNETQDLMSHVLSKYKNIDVLVNNAGIIRDNLIGNISEQDWDQVIGVNLKGTFLCCQAAFPSMKLRRYGKIVNISSRSWLGNIGQSNYSASKGGVVSLTRTLALEFARFEINVNAVAPGLIDTPMTQGMPEQARERLLKMQPTGKMGSVSDIANAVTFLASDEAQFITGQVLHVDGGKSCGILSL